MSDERASWVTTTHDWMREIDAAHLADVRARRHELGADDSLHLVLEVLAYADDEASTRGERGQVEVTRGRHSVSVRDDGRGTDTRRDEHGNPIRKPVMATRDVRFFDASPPVLLPDGLPRRGMSVVAAVSRSLTHTNRRWDGSWAQIYRYGLPQEQLQPIQPDGTTGTTVCFTLENAADLHGLPDRARAFAHIDVRVGRA